MTAAKRIPLRERVLPDYTRGEEIVNMVTHIVGGSAGILILIGSILIGAAHESAWAIVTGCVYALTTILLFVVSSIYHGLKDGTAKRVMQVIDHCTIYFMIAGTYTPILLTAIRPENAVAAWIVFGVEWGAATVAAVFTAIDLKKYARLSMACYIAMGWAIICIVRLTLRTMTLPGFLWLLGGGVIYTVGAVLYQLGKKRRYIHCVFHVFVNLGSILQAVAILCYVL